MAPSPSGPGFVPSPTGEQWLLSHGDQHAVVVEVGGGLRTYGAAGADIVAGYPANGPCLHGRGQVLAPWPNRLRDGLYQVDGQPQQLPITEVARHNASHGLVRWALWDLVRQEPDLVEVRYRLHPQPGWRWQLDLHQSYRLGESGLSVTVRAHNRSDTPAPFAYGAPPYLATHGAAATEITVHIPAERVLQVDPQRLLPIETIPVAGTAYDLRRPRAVGEFTALDTAYTDLAREGERWRVRVGTPTAQAEVWAGPGLDWVQVFSEKASLPSDGPYPPGVAVEPMSAPPDAFNSGTDLVWIGPDQVWSAQWGISRA